MYVLESVCPSFLIHLTTHIHIYAGISPSQSFASLDEIAGRKISLRESPYPVESGVESESPVDRSCDSMEELASSVTAVREKEINVNAVYQSNLEPTEPQDFLTSGQPVSSAPVSSREENHTVDRKESSPRTPIKRSLSPPKTSTVVLSQGKMSFGEFQMLSGEPHVEQLGEVTNQETPIKSSSKTQKSYESELRTPNETELLSEPPFMSILQGDATGLEAEAYLMTRYRFRRVRCRTFVFGVCATWLSCLCLAACFDRCILMISNTSPLSPQFLSYSEPDLFTNGYGLGKFYRKPKLLVNHLRITTPCSSRLYHSYLFTCSGLA